MKRKKPEGIKRSRVKEFGWVYRCPSGHYIYASTKREQVEAARRRHEQGGPCGKAK